MYYLCDIDFLYLIFCFRGMLRWFFYPLLTKEPKSLCFCEDDNIILKIHFQYNTLNHLTYCKQSYCKDIKICTTFGTPEGQLLRKHRSCLTENDFVISKLLIRRYFFETIGRQYFTKTIAFQLPHDIDNTISLHKINKI